LKACIFVKVDDLFYSGNGIGGCSGGTSSIDTIENTIITAIRFRKAVGDEMP
jgi:hypothetical protein